MMCPRETASWSETQSPSGELTPGHVLPGSHISSPEGQAHRCQDDVWITSVHNKAEAQICNQAAIL